MRDDPTGHRPGGPAPGGPGAGADTVLAALAHRLRARSERQHLLTERLRSGELRPGALADLAELSAAARRGVRDGDHILVMAGADVPRHGGGGPVPLGQALSTAVAASEAASRTVVPPTPSVSLEPSAGPVFGQILAELLAHATAATGPGERLELHTRWGPDGGLVLELLSPRPVPTRTPVEDLDPLLAAGAPDGPVEPQEIGLFLAARLARALGGRLGVRGSAGVASAPGPSPVAVLQLPPSVFGGARSGAEDGDSRPSAGASDAADAPDAPDASAVEAAGEPPTGLVPSGAANSGPVPTTAFPSGPVPAASADPEPSIPPWPPLAAAAEAAPANGSAPDLGSPSDSRDVPSGPGPIARLPVPPAPSSSPPPPPNPFPPAERSGPPDAGTAGSAGSGRPSGPSGSGLQIPPGAGSRGPGAFPGFPGTPSQPDPNRPGPLQAGPGYGGSSQGGPNHAGPGPNQGGSNQTGPDQGGHSQAGPNQGAAAHMNQGGSHRGGPSQGGPNQGGPNQGGPNQGGPNQSGPNQSGPNQSGPNQSGPNQAGSDRTGLYQAGPDRTGSNPAGPYLAGPNQTGPDLAGLNQTGPDLEGLNRTGSNQTGPDEAGSNLSGPNQPWLGRPTAGGPPADVPSVTEALPVPGTTPPVELFGPFDSEVPVPVDDLDGTPIFAAVASAWFRDPNTPPNGAAAGPPNGTNGRRPDEPANWSTVVDAEFEAARSRADRVVEPPVSANGLPQRRPGQQMVPPSRRDDPSAGHRTPSSAERQPDRVRNRLASYQRGLREGRHRAADESSGPPPEAAEARNLNGATSHGRNGHGS